VDTDGTLVTLGGQAVLDEPTTRTLESVGVDLCPGHRLPFRSGQEADDGITVTASVKFGLPESFVGTTLLGAGLLQFLLKELEVVLGLAL